MTPTVLPLINVRALYKKKSANFCPIISRHSIIKSSTSLNDIWQKIRLHFGFQSSGSHFLDLSQIKQLPDERPEDLFQPLTACLRITWSPPLVEFYIMVKLYRQMKISHLRLKTRLFSRGFNSSILGYLNSLRRDMVPSCEIILLPPSNLRYLKPWNRCSMSYDLSKTLRCSTPSAHTTLARNAHSSLASFAKPPAALDHLLMD